MAIVGIVAGMLTAAASTAGAATCSVKDGTTSSSDLQSVIDGAASGDTIVIKGVCVGNFSIPGAGSATTLTLKGKASQGQKATLDGGGAGSVVYVGGATVTFATLLITNGHAQDGGGILNDLSGSITLMGTFVNGNAADQYGGGIENIFGTVHPQRCVAGERELRGCA